MQLIIWFQVLVEGYFHYEARCEKTSLLGFRPGSTQIGLYSHTLMEIKGFSQCIAANKQQACGLAAAASCGMVAACEFFVCKLVLLLLVAATLRLIVCCNLAACAFFVCKLNFSLLVAACLLQTVAACLLQTVNSCGLFAANSC